MTDKVFTANGSHPSVGAEKGIFVIGDSDVADGQPRNDLGGGTITLEYLQTAGTAGTVGDWHPVMDSGSGTPVLMQFTAAPQAISMLNFGAVRRVRVKLTGATSPDLYAEFITTGGNVKKYTED